MYYLQKRIHSAHQPEQHESSKRDRMQPITKEQLRGLKAKIEEEKRVVQRNQNIKALSDTIRQNVIQTASIGRCVSYDDMTSHSKDPPTRYFYNSMPGKAPPACGHLCGRNVSDISDDVIEKLRETFPDCLIEYRETKAMDGRVIESGILVDWS